MNKDYPNPFDEIRRWLTTTNQQLKDQEYKSIIINLLLSLLFIVCTIVIILVDLFSAVIQYSKGLYYLISAVILKHSEKTKTMKNSFAWDTIFYCCLFTVMLSVSLFFGTRFLHQKAKESNQMVIKYKDPNYDDVFSYYETPELKSYCPFFMDSLVNHEINSIGDETFHNIFLAIYNNKRDFDLNSISEYLSFPLDQYDHLTFKNVSDYLCFLHSIGYKDDVSQGEKLLLQKEYCLLKGMMKVYKNVAIKEFSLGRFYSSNEFVNRFFDIYKNNPEFPASGVNNDMHILKLLLEYKDDLWKNRGFAEYALECVESESYSSIPFFSCDNNYLELINEYFDGVYLLENKYYIGAQEKFCVLYSKSPESSLLAQYCMYMAIRCAYWNYDSSLWCSVQRKIEQAETNFRDVYDKYSPLITLPYFLSDIRMYWELVD